MQGPQCHAHVPRRDAASERASERETRVGEEAGVHERYAREGWRRDRKRQSSCSMQEREEEKEHVEHDPWGRRNPPVLSQIALSKKARK